MSGVLFAGEAHVRLDVVALTLEVLDQIVEIGRHRRKPKAKRLPGPMR